MKIDLFDVGVPQVGLIIACKSGTIYSNQVGGYSCNHPELEGSYYPLGLFGKQLYEYFNEQKYAGWCNNGIDEEDADWIDKLLDGKHLWMKVKVDRTKLKECQEAWVWVIVDAQDSFLYGDDYAKGGAVLTWENSD